MKRVSQFPRSVRPAPDPLGLYFRPNHNDHKVLSNLIAAGDTNFFGVVLDPAHLSRQVELRDQVLDRSIDLILDPKTQEAAAPGRYTDRLGKLHWVGGAIAVIWRTLEARLVCDECWISRNSLSVKALPK